MDEAPLLLGHPVELRENGPLHLLIVVELLAGQPPLDVGEGPEVTRLISKGKIIAPTIAASKETNTRRNLTLDINARNLTPKNLTAQQTLVH